jgi:membrane protein
MPQECYNGPARVAHSRIKLLTLAWRILKGTIFKFLEDRGSFLAAGLAFNLLLYCVPFLLLVISALAYAVGSSDQAMADVQQSAKQLLPQASEAFANTLPKIVEHRNILGLVAVPLFLVLSSWLFGTVRLVLNIVFEAPRNRSYFLAKAGDLVMILLVAFLAILSVGIISLLTFLQTAGENFPLIRDLLKPGWIFSTQVVVYLFTFALFYTLYRFSPTGTISRKAVMVSALFGSGLFSLSKWGFSWYVKLAQANTLIYGTVAGFIFFDLWLYYASLVFILGAELGWVLDRERRMRRGNLSA